MLTCPHCGYSNPDTTKYCGDCGRAILGTPTVVSPTKERDWTTIATKRGGTTGRCADIMFVLDCTGSMGGEINAIKETIVAFADLIKSDGVRARVGLVEFRDRFCDEEARVWKFAGEVFTDNPTLFREGVSQLTATGGGDAPESSLDAVLLATRQPFRSDASKVIVLITDAPPHIPDVEAQSVEAVVEAIRSAGIAQFYTIMNIEDPDSQIYLALQKGTSGMIFPLGKGDNFRERSHHLIATLKALGKTIASGTT
jgi:Mg-chelatase subunit ChlD